MSKDYINKQLERAVHEKNFEEVKALLLSSGADVNFELEEWFKKRATLLHETRCVKMTKVLLSSGAYVNARNMYRDTPLHIAITEGKQFELVRELLRHGADVNATDRKGNTALNHAVKKSYKNQEVIKELLEYGADINIRNCERQLYEDHNSSLDNAMCDVETAKLLIKITLIRNFYKDSTNIIDLSPYKEFRSYSELSSYLDDCACEILQMKTDEIEDNLSLYEIVTKNFTTPTYGEVQCNIHILSVKLAITDYSGRYPIYNDIILKPFLVRANLLDKLSQIQFYTYKLDMINQDVKGEKIILDYDSTYNITEYLSNENLLNFIEAFEDKSNIQPLSSENNLVQPDTTLWEFGASNDAKRARLE